MAISGVTFSGCHVSARDHGVLFSGLLPDGVLRGCEVSYSGGVATIAPGYLIACGRVIEVESTTTVAVSGTYAQVVLTIDASVPSFSLSSVSGSSTTFPALTQDDINDGASTTYQVEMAVIDLGGNSVYRHLESVANPIRIVGEIPTGASADGIYLVTE